MYKTIVVHIDGSADQDSRLRAAAQLAEEHEAHLVGSTATGLAWVNFALMTVTPGVPVPEADFDLLRSAAQDRVRDFVNQASRLGVASLEGRVVEDVSDNALLLHARYADLVVVSQDLPHAGPTLARVRNLATEVVLRACRPVLVVPAAYQGEPLAGTVVAGWDGSAQSTRAISGALPLLRRAANVKLAIVNPDARWGLHGEEPGADMALYLARHGIKVDVVPQKTQAPAGEALLALARDCGAGLMVAGAYGHSRLREWTLGGVTRTLLERAHLPVLTAH